MKLNPFRDRGAAAYSPDKNPAVIYVMKAQPGRPKRAKSGGDTDKW